MNQTENPDNPSPNRWEERLEAVFCTFCGCLWVWAMPARVPTGFKANSCPSCHASPKPGKQIQYSGAERNPAGAVYADQYLTRDAVYTVRKVKQWQHGCDVFLKEKPKTNWADFAFNLSLFTPVGFKRPTTDQIQAQAQQQAVAQALLDAIPAPVAQALAEQMDGSLALEAALARANCLAKNQSGKHSENQDREIKPEL